MELRRPSSLAEAGDGPFLAGGTEVVPQLRSGLLRTDVLVDVRALVPQGIDGTRTARARRRGAEVDPQVPDAARGVPASPSPQPQHGHTPPATRCSPRVTVRRVDGRAAVRRRRESKPRDGEQREHAIFGNGYCASASTAASRRLLALDADRDDPAHAPIADQAGWTEDDRPDCALESGELILHVRGAQA